MLKSEKDYNCCTTITDPFTEKNTGFWENHLARENTDNDADSKGRKGRFSYGWVIVVACLAFITVSYGIRFSFGVFFKPLEQEFGWTRALTSGIFSVYMLLGSVFAIIAGWVADRYGPKIVFLAMGFFNLLGLALTSQAHTLWHLFLTYSLLVAIGTGPIYAVATSVVTRWFLQRRGFALSVVTSGVGLGSIIMAPVAASLITDYGWRMSYIIIGIMAFVIMVPLSFLLKKPASAVVINPSDNKEEAGNLPPYAEIHGSAGQFSIRKAVKSRNFLLILFIWFCYAFCLFLVMTHIVRHAIDLGIDPIQAASLISVSGFANIPARLLMGLASDRFGRKRTAFICAVVMAIAMVLLTQASNLWMLYVFAAVFGAAYGGLSPPTTAMVGDTFGLRNIGLIFGLLEVGWVCGAAVGPALAGYIFDISGRYDLAFLFGIVAALIIAVLVLFLKVSPAETTKATSG